MLGDLRQALHRIRQHPTFTLSIVLVLTLGTGAVAVVLAVAEAVLRPLPYETPERLAVVWEAERRDRGVVEIAYRNYVDWRVRARSFDEMAAFGSVNWDQWLTGRGEPRKVPAAAVSASLFPTLGVTAHLGRVLREADDQPKAAPVVVIGYGFWQQYFGRDPRAIGSRLILDGQGFEIVGVMPQRFDFPKGAQLWIPVVPQIDAASAGIKTDALEARWFGVLFVLGRLAPGVTLDAARRELEALNADIERVHVAPQARDVVLTPFEERLLGKARPAVLLLVGAVGLIVFIACANVATLLLMRASRMRTETAVRLSLGAAPRHIYRFWVADAVPLFAASALGGLALGNAVLPLVIRLAPDSVYRIGDATITSSVVATVVLTMLAAAAATAALIAALTTLKVHLAATLRDSRSRGASPRMRTMRRILVAAEVTFACVLLVGAGLTVRSFMNLRALDLGFDADGVLTFNLYPSAQEHGSANASFYAPVLERINELPDVLDAGGVMLRPLEFEAIGTDTRALADDHPPDDLASWRRFAIPVNKESATPGYFTAMRIPLRDGRYFLESDNENALRVAIISESAAKRLFPTRRAVGARIVAGGDEPGPDGKPPWRTVVGVVSDVRYRGLQDLRFDYYVPYRQAADDPVRHIVVRTRGNPLQAIAQIRREVRQFDPHALVEGITTMESLVDRAVAPWRLNMVLFAVLGVLALSMASVGVYGVVQYAVVERWHELGIRAALGASMPQLIRLVVGEGAALAAIGVAVGIVTAAWATRLMAAILFGVTPSDAATFVIVPGALAAIALLASYVPARSASRADPSLLLRAH